MKYILKKFELNLSSCMLVRNADKVGIDKTFKKELPKYIYYSCKKNLLTKKINFSTGNNYRF